MIFKIYFFKLTQDERAILAADCQTTVGHLQNVAYGYRKPSPELCVLLEANTSKKVTRRDLLPNAWQGIWPELERREGTNFASGDVVKKRLTDKTAKV